MCRSLPQRLIQPNRQVLFGARTRQAPASCSQLIVISPAQIRLKCTHGMYPQPRRDSGRRYARAGVLSHRLAYRRRFAVVAACSASCDKSLGGLALLQLVRWAIRPVLPLVRQSFARRCVAQSGLPNAVAHLCICQQSCVQRYMVMRWRSVYGTPTVLLPSANRHGTQIGACEQ